MRWLNFLLVLMLLTVAAIHFFLANTIDSEEYKKKALQYQISQQQAEIVTLKKTQQQSNGLEARLQFLLALHNKNIRAALVFAQLIKAVPKAVSLSQIKRQNGVITLDGIAPSDLEIVNFMANLQQNELFAQPVLTTLGPNAIGTSRARTFQLRMNQHE